MKIFQGCVTRQQRVVCKILKSLYGLKQAGKLGNKTIIKFFWKIGFTLTNADPYILVYRQSNILIVVRIYVDNLVFGSQSQNGLE